MAPLNPDRKPVITALEQMLDHVTTLQRMLTHTDISTVTWKEFDQIKEADEKILMMIDFLAKK